jgi:3-deoxy-manno-octulosonate cytidylyltransferase (CMP-KDO synthetase)
MFKHKRIVCVIPARLASFRFPEKMLAKLAGRPLLSWVWDAANKVSLFDDVLFAVDDQRLIDCVQSFGGKAVLTSVNCQSGTERLVELVTHNKIDAEVVVNWQGDEPFIQSPMIAELLQSIDNHTQSVWTLKKRITNIADITSRTCAKVVTNKQEQALYFSRAPIPCVRDNDNLDELVLQSLYYKHVGLYAFTKEALQKMATLGTSQLEDVEKLEMLKLLDYGIPITVHETQHEVFGIDTAADLAKAELHCRQK